MFPFLSVFKMLRFPRVQHVRTVARCEATAHCRAWLPLDGHLRIDIGTRAFAAMPYTVEKKNQSLRGSRGGSRNPAQQQPSRPATPSSRCTRITHPPAQMCLDSPSVKTISGLSTVAGAALSSVIFQLSAVEILGCLKWGKAAGCQLQLPVGLGLQL